ncbi:MAG: hypothetical protein ACRCT1_15515 [Microcoleaceae cyanobacterium]
MFQISNPTSTLLSSYHPLSPSIVIEGREPPIIAIDIYKEYGDNKGFSSATYPLPNPSKLLYFYTIELIDEIVDCRINNFTQIFSPEEIDTNTFFVNGKTISLAINRLFSNITVNLSIQKNIPVFAPLVVDKSMTVQTLSCNGITLARGNSVVGNSFIQSEGILLFSRNTNGFDSFSGEGCLISGMIELENPEPKAKILLFDISQSYQAPNLDQLGSIFELTNDINQPFTTEDYQPFQYGEIIPSPDYIDTVDFLGQTFFVNHANIFSPTIGNMFFTSTTVKLFTSIHYASSISP